jgi:hypothetical protein
MMVGALALVGAASQASGATAAGAAPRSGVPARCSTSFNPYQAPTSLLHSCGDRILRLKHLTALAGGGDAYDYGDYTVLVPPRHFNPLKASDRQLREYGMPTRKQIGRRWRVLMRHYRYAKAPTPFLVENPHVRAPAPRPTAVRRPQACLPPSCSTNWAGYYITSPTPLGEVTATWTEPHFVAKGCSGDEFAQWVGIGGTSSPADLGQDGTLFNVPGFSAHQGFIETIDNNSGPPVAASIDPAAGDSFYASTLWDSASSQFSYFMMDNTTGAVYSAHSRTVTADQTTAEVITEAPLKDNVITQLSDFQQVPVTGATAYFAGRPFPFDNSALTHQSLTMEDSSGIVKADPGTLFSDSHFTTTWGACS